MARLDSFKVVYKSNMRQHVRRSWNEKKVKVEVLTAQRRKIILRLYDSIKCNYNGSFSHTAVAITKFFKLLNYLICDANCFIHRKCAENKLLVR